MFTVPAPTGAAIAEYGLGCSPSSIRVPSSGTVATVADSAILGAGSLVERPKIA